MDRALAAQLIGRLELDARVLARVFGLGYRTIEAERAGVRRRLGVCYADGTIRIRLFHASTGRPLKYSSLVDTLCHELAHLRHFNHGLRFQAFYRRILEHARSEGIYRPGREAPSPGPTRLRAPRRQLATLAARGGHAVRRPEQLTLF